MDCNEKERNTFKPISENPIILDFAGCKNISEIYSIIKQRFELPKNYGENLDALWDSLEYYCNYRLRVEIKGLHSLPDELHE